jgi:Tfp pilus assembly protein FimT
MTAIVSPERATSASLTGAVGLLVLAIAVVMMVIAAPTQVRQGTQNPVRQSAVQLSSTARAPAIRMYLNPRRPRGW